MGSSGRRVLRKADSRRSRRPSARLRSLPRDHTRLVFARCGPARRLEFAPRPGSSASSHRAASCGTGLWRWDSRRWQAAIRPRRTTGIAPPRAALCPTAPWRRHRRHYQAGTQEPRPIHLRAVGGPAGMQCRADGRMGDEVLKHDRAARPFEHPRCLGQRLSGTVESRHPSGSRAGKRSGSGNVRQRSSSTKPSERPVGVNRWSALSWRKRAPIRRASAIERADFPTAERPPKAISIADGRS